MGPCGGGGVPGGLEEKQGHGGSEHPGKGKRGVYFYMLMRKDLSLRRALRGGASQAAGVAGGDSVGAESPGRWGEGAHA